jgi:uncharacterized membrane protein
MRMSRADYHDRYGDDYDRGDDANARADLCEDKEAMLAIKAARDEYFAALNAQRPYLCATTQSYLDDYLTKQEPMSWHDSSLKARMKEVEDM